MGYLTVKYHDRFTKETKWPYSLDFITYSIQRNCLDPYCSLEMSNRNMEKVK